MLIRKTFPFPKTGGELPIKAVESKRVSEPCCIVCRHVEYSTVPYPVQYTIQPKDGNCLVPNFSIEIRLEILSD